MFAIRTLSRYSITKYKIFWFRKQIPTDYKQSKLKTFVTTLNQSPLTYICVIFPHVNFSLVNYNYLIMVEMLPNINDMHTSDILLPFKMNFLYCLVLLKNLKEGF